MRGVSDGMRLLMTIDAVGGVWRYAVDACAGLAARGVRPALLGVGPPPAPSQVQEVAALGLPLVWLDQELDWSGGGDTLRRTGDAMAAELRQLRPDVVHVNSPALLPYLDAGVPRVAAAHSCLATWWQAVKGGPLPASWRWHRDATAAGLQSAAVVTVPSAAFAAALREAYGPLPRLQVVHNCTTTIRPQPKESFVLSAGRWWDEAKNLRTLDAAAAAMRSPVLAAGPLRGPGAEAAEPEAATWLGEMPHDDLRRLMARARVFTSLSLYEPFGLAVLEAATAGAALVLADIPTFHELWDSAALFVDPRDAQAVAAALDRVCEDGNQAEWLGAAARIRARNYTRDRQADALLAAYRAVADRAIAV